MEKEKLIARLENLYDINRRIYEHLEDLEAEEDTVADHEFDLLTTASFAIDDATDAIEAVIAAIEESE